MKKGDLETILKWIPNVTGKNCDSKTNYTVLKCFRNAKTEMKEMFAMRDELLKKFDINTVDSRVDMDSENYPQYEEAVAEMLREEVDLKVKSLTYKQCEALFKENEIPVSIQDMLLDVLCKEDLDSLDEQ